MQTIGFPAISNQDARVLVLGTLPGQVSLQKNEYYGQPRNAFWRIMGDLFGAVPGLPYEERTRRLVSSRVALWDVCEAAHRPGSLDSAISDDSVKANDFAGFMKNHAGLALVCFNGAKADALFRRRVLPMLEGGSRLRYAALPSTSPANAAMPYEEKLRRWSIVREACEIQQR